MSILTKNNVSLNKEGLTKEEAIKEAGRLLVEGGYVEPSYVEAMLEREEKASTFMGNSIALPHGTDEAKTFIEKSGISVVQVPGGVDFGKGTAKIVIGIAGSGDEHLEILSQIAVFCSEEANVQKLVDADSEEEIVNLLGGLDV